MYSKIRAAIDSITSGKRTLFELGAIRSERLTGEIGEYYVSEILNAQRAGTSSQKGYDLLLDGKKVQVKAHAKGEGNGARWTEFKYSQGDFDILVIIVMSQDFLISEFYQIPAESVFARINEKKKQRVVDWDNFTDFKIDLLKLPNEAAVRAFSDRGFQGKAEQGDDSDVDR